VRILRVDDRRRLGWYRTFFGTLLIVTPPLALGRTRLESYRSASNGNFVALVLFHCANHKFVRQPCPFAKQHMAIPLDLRHWPGRVDDDRLEHFARRLPWQQALLSPNGFSTGGPAIWNIIFRFWNVTFQVSLYLRVRNPEHLGRPLARDPVIRKSL
jgi:hypothetical protein